MSLNAIGTDTNQDRDPRNSPLDANVFYLDILLLTLPFSSPPLTEFKKPFLSEESLFKISWKSVDSGDIVMIHLDSEYLIFIFTYI